MINTKFSLGDIVNINPNLEGVSRDDVALNPWRIREIRVNENGVSYSLFSTKANASTGYYEAALVFPCEEEKKRYDELFRMTESYIKRLHTAEEENKRLREALERISIGMDVRPFDASAAQVEGYFRGFAEATLKKGG